MRINFYLIKMNNSSFNIDYLSPTGLIGFWILFIGLIFIFQSCSILIPLNKDQLNFFALPPGISVELGL